MDSVDEFNSLPLARLQAELLACCAAPDWGAQIAAGRPFSDRAAIFATADAAARALSWEQVLLALAAHPRIGERADGDTTEAAWSRAEQSAAARTADEAATAALIAANQAYEDRFGHIFLVFASGRSQAEILAAAQERITHDPASEHPVVTDQLRKIALVRLERVLDALS